MERAHAGWWFPGRPADEINQRPARIQPWMLFGFRCDRGSDHRGHPARPGTGLPRRRASRHRDRGRRHFETSRAGGAQRRPRTPIQVGAAPRLPLPRPAGGRGGRVRPRRSLGWRREDHRMGRPRDRDRRARMSGRPVAAARDCKSCQWALIRSTARAFAGWSTALPLSVAAWRSAAGPWRRRVCAPACPQACSVR
jgi:hypothetical protein